MKTVLLVRTLMEIGSRERAEMALDYLGMIRASRGRTQHGPLDARPSRSLSSPDIRSISVATEQFGVGIQRVSEQ